MCLVIVLVLLTSYCKLKISALIQKGKSKLLQTKKNNIILQNMTFYLKIYNYNNYILKQFLYILVDSSLNNNIIL